MTIVTINSRTGRTLTTTNNPGYIAALAVNYTFKIREWISPSYKVYDLIWRS